MPPLMPAYGTGICTTMFGLSPFVGMAVSAVISVFVAFVLGGPALRLKGHYLAMATLGFGAIIHTVAVAAVDITGGSQGISGIPSISLWALNLTQISSNIISVGQLRFWAFFLR